MRFKGGFAVLKVMLLSESKSHKLDRAPDSSAGANDRAGFIEAPDMYAKKNVSKPIQQCIRNG
jgi:hypothetical protein